jgi:hypothetical protein
MRGQKGDFLHDSTGNTLLEFFSKAGSLFKKKETYYEETSVIKLFKPAFTTDKTRAAKLAFWLRDCRGGAGNRSGFRSIVKWLSEKHPSWITANIHLIPETGRWDDLLACFDTPCEDAAIGYWSQAIADKNGLACKWAPREKKNKSVFAKLRKALRLSPKDYRKHLAENTSVVETAMCSGDWHDINYNTVPSVAMARSAKAFLKHDPARYDSWRESLTDEDSDSKVNASTLFPHDVLRTSRGDSKLANAQFDALPNYMEDVDARIMPIADFSGSMSCHAAGSMTAMDIAESLALYCSAKVGEDNPFYKRFIPFSSTSELRSWEGQTFSDAAKRLPNCCRYFGSTNIKSALDQILNSAKMFKVSNDQIPNCLLILSDMQFDQGVDSGSQTVVESCMQAWEEAGYTRPRIVYWNLAGCAGSPARGTHENVALVSGFSPSILGSVLGGTDFSPMAVLDRAIEKYEVVTP